MRTNSTSRRRLFALSLVLGSASTVSFGAAGCSGDSDSSPLNSALDAGALDAAAQRDATATDTSELEDATSLDATTLDARDSAFDLDAPVDARVDASADANDTGVDSSDAADAPDASDGANVDASFAYSCGAFTENPGWAVAAGFRAVVVAKTGLNQPGAVTFAGGGFGNQLYVLNQGDNVLRTVDTVTGAVASFTAGAQWGVRTPSLLTTITWDEENIFDGALYVGDQGGTGDQDSAIYRVTAAGAGSTFTAAPGPGLDDVFGLAFAPKSGAYPQGLFVTGDTDGTLVDWGVFASNGVGVPFSEVAGAEGITFAAIPGFDGALLASRPNGGGYAGTDEVSRIETDGAVGTSLATGLTGVHAVTYSQRGTFGQNVYVASWETGRLLRINAAGGQTELASGLTLTNYDGNILAVSPDGNTMMIADRSANRIVCIEAL